MKDIFRHYCTRCKNEKDFHYSNSTLIAGRHKVDYYKCEDCGETYKKSYLENIIKYVTTKKFTTDL